MAIQMHLSSSWYLASNNVVLCFTHYKMYICCTVSKRRNSFTSRSMKVFFRVSIRPPFLTCHNMYLYHLFACRVTNVHRTRSIFVYVLVRLSGDILIHFKLRYDRGGDLLRSPTIYNYLLT